MLSELGLISFVGLVLADLTTYRTESSQPPRSRVPHGAPFLRGQAAPDAGVLTTLQRGRQTLRNHRTATADRLRVLDLLQRGTARSHREEELRIFAPTRGPLAPIVHERSFYARCTVRGDQLPAATR